jgi:hypothetical protein
MTCRKANNNDVASTYVNLDILCGKFGKCEQLFSIKKNIFTNARKSLPLLERELEGVWLCQYCGEDFDKVHQ